MPDYKIRHPDTGQTITLRGDSPPTEQELEEIFATMAGPPSTLEASHARIQKADDARLMRDLGANYMIPPSTPEGDPGYLDILRRDPGAFAATALGQVVPSAMRLGHNIVAGVPGILRMGAQHALNMPDFVGMGELGQGVIDRYGGGENIARTVATDPVGAAADVAGIVAGGRAAIPEVAAGLRSGARAAATPAAAATPVAGVPTWMARGADTAYGLLRASPRRVLQGVMGQGPISTLDRWIPEIKARLRQVNPEFWSDEGPGLGPTRQMPPDPPEVPPPGPPPPEPPISSPGAYGTAPEPPVGPAELPPVEAPAPAPPPPNPPVVAPPAGVAALPPPPPPPRPFMPTVGLLDPTAPVVGMGPELPPIPPRAMPGRPAPPAPAPAAGLEAEQLLRLQTEHAALQGEAAKMAKVIRYLIDNEVSPEWASQPNLGAYGNLGFRDVFARGRALAEATGNPELIEALSRASQRLRMAEVELGRPRTPKTKKGTP